MLDDKHCDCGVCSSCDGSTARPSAEHSHQQAIHVAERKVLEIAKRIDQLGYPPMTKEYRQVAIPPDKSILIIGTGPGWQSDILEALHREEQFTSIGVLNRAGIDCQIPINYWFTMDPEVMQQEKWEAQREHNTAYAQAPNDYHVISIPEGYINRFLSGSIAMYATLWSMHMLGYDHIHLAGCPFSGPYEFFRQGWMIHKALFQQPAHKVTAQSGWLKEFLESR